MTKSVPQKVWQGYLLPPSVANIITVKTQQQGPKDLVPMMNRKCLRTVPTKDGHYKRWSY